MSQIPTQSNVLDVDIRGVSIALASAVLTLVGLPPIGLPSGVTIYLSLVKTKNSTLTIIPILASKKPHLKSIGLPVSPTKPHTSGARNAPKLIPI